MTEQKTDEDDAPPVWKLSALARSMFDFELMLEPDRHGSYFRNIETLEGLSNEQKRLYGSINLFYLTTFLGACFVLLQPTLKGATISFMGLEASVGIVPQQVVSLVTAIAYSMYAAHFASLILLSNMISQILKKEGHDAWQFFAARFDATTLWSVLITPRTVGYKSPKRHVAATFGIALVSVLSIIAHAVVIGTATAISTWTAWQTGPWYLVVFAAFSALIVFVSILSLLLLVGLRLPFRLDFSDGEESSTQEPQ